MQSVNVVGTWKLISVKAENQNHEVIYPYGEKPYGMLMYNPKGCMSVLIARRGRSKFVSGDLLGGTPEEIKEAFQGFDAYCGTYDVNTGQATVVHHVEGARFPNWEGTDQLRYFELSEKQLVLKTPPILAFETEWVASLAWERMAEDR